MENTLKIYENLVDGRLGYLDGEFINYGAGTYQHMRPSPEFVYIGERPAPKFDKLTKVWHNDEISTIYNLKVTSEGYEYRLSSSCSWVEEKELREIEYQLVKTGLYYDCKTDRVRLRALIIEGVHKLAIDRNGKTCTLGDYVKSRDRLWQVQNEHIELVIPERGMYLEFDYENYEVVNKKGVSLISGEPLTDPVEVNGYTANREDTVVDHGGRRYPYWSKCDFCKTDEKNEHGETIYISYEDIDDDANINTEYGICDNCGQVVLREELTCTEDGEVCETCLENDYLTCEYCGVIYHREHIRFVENIACCDDCFEETHSRCMHCGEFYHNEDLEWHESGERICNECGEENYRWDDDRCEYVDPTNAIRDYHDSPDYIYYANGEAEYRPKRGVKYLGVELEIQDGGEDDEKAIELIGTSEKHLFAMQDGSLKDGFEVISMPATIEEHLNGCMPWKNVLPKANSMGYRGRNGGGLHIHVSKQHFVDDDAIGECVRFVSENFKAICRFGCRELADGKHWAAPAWEKDKGDEYPACKGEWLEKAYDKDKYQAVNVSPSLTIEFRLFRSTLEVRHFRAVLQFVDCLTDLANEVDEITFPLIRELAEEKGYGELIHDMNYYDLL